MTTIKLEQVRRNFPAYFVYSKKIIELWRHDHLFVGSWEGPSNDSWFRWSLNLTTGEKREAFYTADMSIFRDESGYFLNFRNGRHRTIWLLQTENSVIPVGISNDSIELAHKLGLIFRKTDKNDRMCSEFFFKTVTFS